MPLEPLGQIAGLTQLSHQIKFLQIKKKQQQKIISIEFVKMNFFFTFFVSKTSSRRIKFGCEIDFSMLTSLSILCELILKHQTFNCKMKTKKSVHKFYFFDDFYCTFRLF
jgi:hypothetical protein